MKTRLWYGMLWGALCVISFRPNPPKVHAAPEAKTKTRYVQVLETIHMSRECPPDASGSKNNWYINTTEGETIVMMCNYTVEDTDSSGAEE